MRFSLVLPLLLPFPALADDIAVASRVNAVTAFPQGAAITRSGTFTAPAGQHQLILTDMPVAVTGLRVMIDGATMGTLTTRSDFKPPRTPANVMAVEQARATVDRLETALQTARDDIATIRAAAAAARARIAFLKQIGDSDGLATAGADTLRDLSRMVGAETLDAETTALAAEARARDAEKNLKDQIEELADARRALAALDLETENRDYLAVSVTSDTQTTGTITVTYQTDAAGWAPVYDLHLTREPAALRLERGAYVTQHTGENWDNVALTLSTNRPSGQSEPGELYPDLRHMFKPQPVLPRASIQMESDTAAGAFAAAPAESPMPRMKMASAQFDGLNVTYDYPSPVSIANNADRLRLTLGTLDVTPEIFAQAVPIRDETAYLMAEFTNDANELILPSSESAFYLDGTFVAMRPTPLIANGDDVTFGFGPIEGIRTTRIRDRNEGDRGVITKSNEITESATIEIRNLTGETWDMRLIDQVPYSEQEDLEITWNATPMPTETDVDDKKGVLAWTIPLAPGDTKQVKLGHRITWPKDMMMR